jgi:putative tryptophan/tyrosine transport system substrate-binding protein
MDRRTFIGSAALFLSVTSLAGQAQPARLRRIGFLGNGNPTTMAAQQEAFDRGLREQGWIEGRTITIDYRWADGNPDRLPAFVAALLQAKVEVIVLSGTPAIRAAQRATSTIPIVFVVLADPVTSGLVPSLARPGGNMTGLASQYEELIAKQLQLLKEALPNISRVALLHHSDIPPAVLAAARTTARSLNLSERALNVAGSAGFENAFKMARSERMDAIHVLPSPYLAARRKRLIDLAAEYQLPAFYELKDYVEDGGLISYGPSITDMFGRSASFVDRILKGAKPGDLAIERPSRFELAINARTAAALGLTLPPSLLQRADEVIR